MCDATQMAVTKMCGPLRCAKLQAGHQKVAKRTLGIIKGNGPALPIKESPSLQLKKTVVGPASFSTRGPLHVPG